MLATAKKQALNLSEKVGERIDQLESRVPLVKAPRTVWLAGLGALAESKESVEAVFDRLVEKGEATHQETTEKLQEWLDRSKQDVTEVENKVEEKIDSLLDERIERVLNSMNIPSKKDIDELGRKISTLSRKVGELDKKLSESTKKAA
ncbi:MAG: poly(hydroxyalkanoate) granule-associated protein [Caldilineae bacterium]|nr:MAG: poly(hydroxyalkanoate) granule-associated protein [Caldilineae bacterium]